MNITLLAEALEKFTRSITLVLKAGDVTNAMITNLKKMIKAKSGNCHVKIRIEDSESKTSLLMQPRNNAVNPVVFLRELNKLPDIEYKLN